MSRLSAEYYYTLNRIVINRKIATRVKKYKYFKYSDIALTKKSFGWSVQGCGVRKKDCCINHLNYFYFERLYLEEIIKANKSPNYVCYGFL